MTYYLDDPRAILTTSTSDPYGINSTRSKREVWDKIFLLDAQNTALLTLTRNTRRKPTSTIKFEWFEDIFPAQYTTCASDDSTTTDTSITVATNTGAYGREGDLWLNGDNGEVIYIASVSTDTWTVVRGVGSTTAADWDSGDALYYIGNAQDQGDTARPKLTTQTTALYNYAQLQEEGYEVTNDAKVQALYGGNDLVYLRQKHGTIHNRDLERMLWFGVRGSMVHANSSNITYETFYSKGVIADGTNGFLSTNSSTTNSSGEYTEDEFDTDLITAFRYGNGVKTAFCAPAALSVISGWGRDKLQMFPRDKTYGINITRFISPHGELNLINNKLFGDFSGAGTTWGAGLDYAHCIVILDLENVWYRPFRDTELQMNIQGNDEDTTQEQYITRAGLELHNEQTCMDIYGVRVS